RVEYYNNNDDDDGHYGIGSTSGDGDGALESAITNGHAWPTLAQADRVRLKALWVAYDQFSLFLKGRRAAHVSFAPFYLKSSSPSLRGSPAGRDLLRTMADDLNDSFIRYILVKERFTHPGTKLRDICAYLPVAEDLSRFWRPIDPAAFRWMWMPNKQDWNCWQVKNNNEWTVDDTVRLIPQLREAQRDLNHAKAEDLRRLASLYELFPTYLTTPYAPPIPRLVPYDWCFQLFNTALQQPEMSEMRKATETLGMEQAEERGRTTETGNESDFQADLQKARDGMDSIYTSGLPRTSIKDGYKRQQLHDLNGLCLPSPVEELDWLESFMRCVEWMETQFPDLASELKAASIKDWYSPNDRELLQEADFQRFINSYTYLVVQQLKADLKASRNGTGKLPSLVALYLPPFSSPRAREIAGGMWPQADLRSGVRQMMYEEMVKTIKGSQFINVSSCEGIFESQLDSPAKAGKHVHTNMSKAGVNMITETEAATAWKQRKVAMNTVDPGYMSSAPEFDMAHGGERP
ncbi:hypothetical protein CMUS01_16674, partial [Colletotrichum musicola]